MSRSIQGPDNELLSIRRLLPALRGGAVEQHAHPQHLRPTNQSHQRHRPLHFEIQGATESDRLATNLGQLDTGGLGQLGAINKAAIARADALPAVERNLEHLIPPEVHTIRPQQSGHEPCDVATVPLVPNEPVCAGVGPCP